MSISRKSSFDTVVVEKARDDPLLFLSNPGNFRKDLDLKGLSDVARKSFTALRPWKTATLYFFDATVSPITVKVVERADECHAVLKASLAVAQMGRLFADDVVALCNTLAQGHESPERLNERLEKAIATAEKGYGRSIQAQGQLICIRHGLSQISESIPLQVAKIQENTRKENTFTSFNGMDTLFVTLMPMATTDDDESSDIWKAPMSPSPYLPYSYLTFQNVTTQLNSIATDILRFTEQVGKCIEWWSQMKDGMEVLKSAFPRIIHGRPYCLKMLPDNLAEAWECLADQFVLYVLKTSLVVKDYDPYNGEMNPIQYIGPYTAPAHYPAPAVHHRPERSYSPPYSPRINSWHDDPSTPSPVIRTRELPPNTGTIAQEEKAKSLWKKLSCGL